MLLSNQKLAKSSLSQRPKFRDAKFLLAVKYKELEKLKNIIQAKQERLAEKNSAHYVQHCLMKKINDAEEECELLFQRFEEGKVPPAYFLDSFLSLRKSHHITLVLLKKLQEVTDRKQSQRPDVIHPSAQYLSVGFPQQIHNPSRVPAVLWPTCCHPLTSPPLIYPPILLPFGAHVGTDHCLQDLSFCLNSVSLHPGLHGQGVKWPVRPVRLQPLKGQHRRHEQGPR
ncbi:uncharacterized protein LOC115431988 isoform X2 [Sphaeramia orbicularis]|nr:uncharacterized protein LOC115431988 isoform X2 [Sphaeramia orbicularis]